MDKEQRERYLVEVGRVMRAAREAAGHTQTYAATLLRWDQSYLSKFERGEREMGIWQAREFAELYGLDLGILIDRPKRKRKISNG